MCGIFGIYSSNPAHREYTPDQLSAIRHRGPDENGTWENRQVFLGSCRLSIIDIAGGHQPMLNENKTCCLVYNGELYNYQDLRSRLQGRGYSFVSESDTEVILHSYEEWGTDCLKKFNGMFAFAIWDDRKQFLFVARDRIGEKPLYYYEGPDRFVFASEIKAIIADKTIPRAVNPKGLANYLAFGHAMAPDTMFDRIYKLLPGHYLVAHGGGVETKQYWDVGDEPQGIPDDLKDEELGEQVVALLDDSVRRRMIADVPVGAFLSGGLDSSVVVALMKRHATGRVKTFSLGFTVGGAYNELPDAKLVAQALETEHFELHVDHFDMIDTLRKLVYQYDEPFGDAANFPLYLLSEFARREVKVVLAGEGGDELFGGYRRYVADLAASKYQKLPTSIRNGLIPALAGLLPRLRRIKRIVRTLPIADPAIRYAGWLEVFTREMQREILQPTLFDAIAEHDPLRTYEHYYRASADRVRSPDHLNRILYVDVKTWLPDAFMEKVDKATMAFGLEGRLPFLDHRLVELAFQIPGEYKIKGSTTKRILRNAVENIVPREVVAKAKHGFAVPTDQWFRGTLKDFVFEILTDEKAKRRGFFDPASIERLYNLHRNGREVYDTHLWLLLNFELWHQTYIDG